VNAALILLIQELRDELPWAGTEKIPQPRWGCDLNHAFSQGSSFLATLG
jgi:hypothetical protein